MAIKFKNLQDPKLALTDTIMVGKLAGCKVRDVVEDYYEYLMWAETSGLIQYQPQVIHLIEQRAILAGWLVYNPPEPLQCNDDVDDVPF